MKITYFFLPLSLLLIFSILEAFPGDKNLSQDEIVYKFSNPLDSRVLISNGAKVFIDDKASAKILYDELVLIKGAKLIFASEDIDKALESNQIGENSQAAVTGLPTELTISKAFPNPFNPIVNISYGLPESGNVRILIHDLSGRKIADYNMNHQSAGWHEFNWNAVNQSGESVGTGIYLMTIQASDMVKQQKITYLK